MDIWECQNKDCCNTAISSAFGGEWYGFEEKTICPSCAKNHEDATASIDVPRKFWDASLIFDFKLKRAADFVSRLIFLNKSGKKSDEPLLMFFLGIPGCGKTHAMHGMRNDMASQGVFSWLYNAKKLRSDWLGASDRNALEERVSTRRILFLDDVTSADATAGWTKALQGIINHRIENLMPTVLSAHIGRGMSGASEGDGKKRFADLCKFFGNENRALSDRLKEFEVVVFPEESLRGKNNV